MHIIKHIYFYLFAAVGLVFVLIGLVMLIQLGLRAWVFPQADQYISYPVARPLVEVEGQKTVEPSQEEMEKYQKQELASRRQREATNAIAFLLVGIPLFAFHFRTIKKHLKE